MGQRQQRSRRQRERDEAARRAAEAARGPLGRRTILWLAVGVAVAGVLIGGALVARGTGPAQVTSSGGTADGALELSGTDPITGEQVSLASYAGKPVVLAIWASWCHGCNDEAPHLGEVAKRRSDVAFVGLNFQDSGDGARWFYGEYGWDFPSIADPSGEKALALGLQGTPTTIFLDAEHREIGRIVGATDEAGFESAIDQALAAA